MTPEELEKITKRIEEIASLCHTRALLDIIERVIARFKISFSSTDAYQIETLRESMGVRTAIFKHLSELLGTSFEEIKKAYEKAVNKATEKPEEGEWVNTTPPTENERTSAQELYTRAIDEDKLKLPDVEAPVKKTLDIVDPHTKAIAERDLNATNGTFYNLVRSTADAGQQAFIQVCDKAYTLSKTGMVSINEAVATAITELAQNGVQMVTYSHTDKNGKTKVHRDTIETATLRAVRTAINQATAEIVIAKMKEMGEDCVQVSSHMGARDTGTGYENHFLWQGKQYSLSGNDPDLPDFKSSTGYGTGAGLCGWNCRHTITIGVKGFNTAKQYSPEENHKAYELSQKQRAMERAIRKQARAVNALAKVSTESQELMQKYQTELTKLQKMNMEYEKWCLDNDLKPEELRRKIG